jgi:hypothetical protein
MEDALISRHAGKIGAVFLLFYPLIACATPRQAVLDPATADLAPASTPTAIPASPTPTPTPPPIPEGPCVNVLYPLLPGSEWIYQTETAEGQARITFLVTGIEDDLASFEVADEISGVTTRDTVRCQDGAIVNLPLVYISLLLSDYLDGVLNTYQESGITSPSYQTFDDNGWSYRWGVVKLVEQPVKVQPPGLQSGHILPGNVLEIQSETTGVREAATVPAGSFPQAVLVTSEMRIPVTIESSSASFTVRYREWYEPFVGLLKIKTDGSSLDYTGVPIPMPLERTLELVSCTKGAE